MNQEWLFIDTHIPGQSRLGWLSLDARSQVRSYNARATTLLRRLFSQERVRLEGCQGICVVAGPGSFSSIRTGVLYANLLARLLGKPLVGVRIDQDQTKTLAGICQALKEKRVSEEVYVAPVYDAEPNITLPRVV